MDQFFHYLSSLAPLPAELQAALVTRTTTEKHRAKKTILSRGEVCDWIGFVESGLVKVGYDVPDEDERIVQFAKSGDTVFGIGSLTTGLPSKMAVVAMEDVVIRKIRKAEIDVLASRHPAFHNHIRKIIEAHALILEEHYLLYLLPARQRYLKLVESGSWILVDPRIPDYMIADYLGIGRGSFSRFRNGKKR